MKKLFAALLAVIMVMILSVPALAAGDTGAITVKEATAGQTYTIYKLFDLAVTGEQYTYTIDTSSSWYAFFDTGAGSAYVSLKENGGDSYRVAWSNAGTPADLAKTALAYAKAQSISSQGTQTAVGDTVSFADLPLGYYLVDSSVGALVMLDSLDSTGGVEITEKNYLPNISKQVEEDSTLTYGAANDADIGQTVNFKITIATEAGRTITGDPAKGAQNYVLTDTLAAGLTYTAGSIAVKMYSGNADETSAETVAAADYTFAETGDGFTVTFAQGFLDTLKANDKLLITYSAVLNENAVIAGAGNENSAVLAYGDNMTLEPSKTTTYTWDMDVYKYNDQGEGLSGAEFTLSKNAGGTDPIAFVQGGNTYRVAKSGETDTVTKFVTPDDGRFTLKGLDADTYYLTETLPPENYNQLEDPVKVVISQTAGSYESVDGAGNTTTITYGHGDTLVNSIRVDEVAVLNSKGAELPATGGIGTTIFYVLGSILVAGAVVLLVARKRMHDAE